MRCIEIVPADVCVNNTIRLTLTWDVLKSSLRSGRSFTGID